MIAFFLSQTGNTNNKDVETFFVVSNISGRKRPVILIWNNAECNNSHIIAFHYKIKKWDFKYGLKVMGTLFRSTLYLY